MELRRVFSLVFYCHILSDKKQIVGSTRMSSSGQNIEKIVLNKGTVGKYCSSKFRVLQVVLCMYK